MASDGAGNLKAVVGCQLSVVSGVHCESAVLSQASLFALISPRNLQHFTGKQICSDLAAGEAAGGFAAIDDIHLTVR